MKKLQRKRRKTAIVCNLLSILLKTSLSQDLQAYNLCACLQRTQMIFYPTHPVLLLTVEARIYFLCYFFGLEKSCIFVEKYSYSLKTLLAIKKSIGL